MAETQDRKADRTRGAVSALYLIGGLNLLLGAGALFLKYEWLQQSVYPPFAIVYGLAFLGLGFFARRNAELALLIGLVVFGLDALLSAIGLFAAGTSPSLATIVVRLTLVIVLYIGWQAARRQS